MLTNKYGVCFLSKLKMEKKIKNIYSQYYIQYVK